jgi:hypothetical protein
MLGKAAGKAAGLQHKLMGLFPDFEVTKIFHVLTSKRGKRQRSTLPPATYQN